jgi:hypothetical protein
MLAQATFSARTSDNMAMAEMGLMRFFTREWEDGEVDSDSVARSHRQHSEALRPRLPSPLHTLVEAGGEFWLHDAQPEGLQRDVQSGRVTLNLRALDYANATESVSLSLEYAGGALIGIGPGEIEEAILHPKARILRSELGEVREGAFEHRFSLWSPRYFEFAIGFSDASLSLSPYPLE